MESPKFRVYIIRNGNDQIYIGLSENVTLRLEQHNTGVSKWTKYRGPWDLIWTSNPLDLSSARKLELLLKRQKGGDGLYRLTGLCRRS